MSNIKVLYEDNHIIAVFKPAGVLSQPDKTGNPSMLEEVKKYLKEKYHKPGNVFVGLLHRLDRPVSGIMIFAKTSKGASRLSEQFRNQEIEKTYEVIVIGKPVKEKGMLKNVLGKDIKTKKANEYADGQEAVLYYEVIKSNDTYSLLKISIEGGKFHQIRAQLSAAGFPILGDVKYGGQTWNNEKSIALCATGLSFKKATEDRMVHLQIKTPEEWEGYLPR
jgi:23S rRNA pseudouridine1911/1915/1917 synthase